MLPSEDLSSLLAAIRQQHISAESACEHYLERIQRLNPQLNALIHVDAVQALAAARALDSRIRAGEPIPVLAGAPISIKDAFATSDMPTSSSHPPLLGHLPEHDATLVARLRAAGAILLGKSNLPELAGDPQCWSPLHGPTHNPWQLDHTPGGSSGGSAVAIAAGLSALELGSDLAGSIRIPAAYCGIVGHKATENRLPRTGHIPHLPQQGRSVWHCLSFGALGRRVRDVRLAFSVLHGADGLDSTVPPLPLQEVAPLTRRPRIAWWDDFAGLPLCQRTRQALKQTVASLKAAGCELVRAQPAGFDVGRCWQAFGTLAGGEVGLGMPRSQSQALRWLSLLLPARMGMLKALGRGARFDLQAYNLALQWREEQIHSLEQHLQYFDAWLCPVAPTTAYPARPITSPWQQPPDITVDGHALPYFEATISLTAPFSLTGHPVVSLPAGIFDGLPVGLQLVGARWQDEKLLALAEVLESHLPARQWPGLAAAS